MELHIYNLNKVSALWFIVACGFQLKVIEGEYRVRNPENHAQDYFTNCLLDAVGTAYAMHCQLAKG